MSLDHSYAAVLLAASSYVSNTLDFITVIAGAIGGICNLITFTAPKLRRNACVFYLLCATVFQLLFIFFILPARLAATTSGSALERQSIVFCKIRFYLVITLPEMATYSLLLSTMDRCVATSDEVGMRAWSSFKVAVRLTAGTVVLVFASNIHIIVFYTIYNDNCQTVPDTVYTFFVAGYLLLVVIVLPQSVMLILCVLTYLHMKRTKRRVAPPPLNTINHRPTHRFESQIVAVIVVQVIVSTVLMLLRFASYTYTVFTSGNLNKTSEQRATEGFVFQLALSVYYCSLGIMFYVSTLTSKYFRDIFVKRIGYFYRRIREQFF